jgi:hypothetical protein
MGNGGTRAPCTPAVEESGMCSRRATWLKTSYASAWHPGL